MESDIALFAGIIASVLHVITGPDHLAAVLPFAIESKRKAWKIGLFWGIGHLTGMIAIGLLFVLFKNLIPVDQISEYSEQLVGLVLIAIGFWVIFKLFRKDKHHKHLHVHSENRPLIHSHEHKHLNHDAHNHKHSKHERQSYLASLWIGILHGLAGIAHFLILLPVLGFETQLDSITYILGFAIGTVSAMTFFAFIVGKLSLFSKANHNNTFFNGIRVAAGLFAIIIGVYWFFSN